MREKPKWLTAVTRSLQRMADAAQRKSRREPSGPSMACRRYPSAHRQQLQLRQVKLPMIKQNIEPRLHISTMDGRNEKRMKT
jgi:hypothetical protein